MRLPASAAANFVGCLFCCLLCWRNWNILNVLIAAWLAIESVFAYVLSHRAGRICASASRLKLPEHDGLDLMRKVLSHLQFTPEYLTAWFLDAQLHHIHLGNLREFMAYGFWYKTYDQLSEEDRIIIESAIQQMEQQTGLFLPEGYNSKVRFMSHLWDPLRTSYRPLAFYIGTECVALLTHILLTLMGFKRHRSQGADFYTLHLDRLSRDPHSSCYGSIDSCMNRQGSSSLPDNKPLLFLHGVGLGLFPYLWLVHKLAATGRPLIMPQYKHIAMRFTWNIPTVQDCADSAAAFLSALGIQHTHVMGHSYGTLVCSRFVNCHENSIASLVLLDPVCFSMYMPTLLHRFVYAEKGGTAMFGGALGWCLDKAWAMVQVSRELHIAATFCRDFLWSEYNLWPDCLPARTLVALSAGDELVAPDVKDQLEAYSNAKLMYHPTMCHGGMLLRPSYMDLLLHSWEQLLAEPVVAKQARKATGTLAGIVGVAKAPAATGTKQVQAEEATAGRVQSVACEDDSQSGSSSSDEDAFMLVEQLSSALPAVANKEPDAFDFTFTARKVKVEA